MTVEFLRQFLFNGTVDPLIGIERERFLEKNGEFAPLSLKLTRYLNDERRFGPELSAFQLEDRTSPVLLPELGDELERNDDLIRRACRWAGAVSVLNPVAPKNLPLDITDLPRYEGIRGKLSEERLSAACRVAGTHIHCNMPDLVTAVQVHDSVRRHIDDLIALGDTCGGERLHLYRKVAPNASDIPEFGSVLGFYEDALRGGWVEDPRSCYRLIRISVHGTIEFRMFDATNDNGLVLQWAAVCSNLCQEAINRSAA